MKKIEWTGNILSAEGQEVRRGDFVCWIMKAPKDFPWSIVGSENKGRSRTARNGKTHYALSIYRDDPFIVHNIPLLDVVIRSCTPTEIREEGEKLMDWAEAYYSQPKEPHD